MYRTLIVDDNSTNIMILRLMIDEYRFEHNIDFEIIEALNGAEAVELTNNSQFDIIFMDIMMPVMDGIEATKLIRAKDKKAMIIAISAIEDEEKKRLILKNGAEDYIQKPITEYIFYKRLTSYLQLIDSRKSQITHSCKAINLFDTKIYSRYMTFIINSENSLSEFWDYYLINCRDGSDDMSDLVRTIYGIGLLQLKFKYSFNVYVEENAENFYFTANNMNLLDKNGLTKLVQKIITNNYKNSNYKIADDKISFALNKNSEISAKNIEIDTKILHKEVETTKTPVISKKEEVYEIYHFLDPADLEDLENFANELNSMMLLVGSSKLEMHEVLLIAQYIYKFGSILTAYSETFAISSALKTLADDIQNNSQTFIEKSKDIGELCRAFNGDLLMWIRKLFYEGAPAINFLDNSIIANATMISSFIKPQEDIIVGDLDNIFDF